jgi:opacity protein-like surface antigen
MVIKMNKFTMLASVAVVAVSASALAADYKTVKEVKTDVVAVAADVASPQDFYATLGVGYGKFSNKASGNGASATFKKNKPTFMIGFGKQIDNQVRADLTVDVNSKVAKTKATSVGDTKLDYKSWTVMANAYYQFDDMASVSPYVTAGLGYSKQKVTLTHVATSLADSKRKGHVAYQAGFGVSSKMSDKMTFDLGYRFVHSGKVTTPTGYTVKPTAHKIMAAIRMPL